MSNETKYTLLYTEINYINVMRACNTIKTQLSHDVVLSISCHNIIGDRH